MLKPESPTMTSLVVALPTALPAVERWTPPPADRDPRRVYLAGLAPSSKRVVALRYTHVVAIRQRLVAQDLAPNTINLTLAALRGVAREAWNLEYLTAEEYQHIKSVKGVSGNRLPASRSRRANSPRCCAAAPTIPGLGVCMMWPSPPSYTVPGYGAMS